MFYVPGWHLTKYSLLDLIVVFPFSLAFPPFIVRPIRAFLVFIRVLPKLNDPTKVPKIAFPFNFVTTPLVSVLFLLAIEAIGRQEVQDGIIGANGYVRKYVNWEHLLILLPQNRPH